MRAAGRVAGVLAVVALAGAATLVVELAAVRLLAPWFGTSATVWTNVIGVVLLALALGYLFGARLAVGRAPLRLLGLCLLAAAAATAWLPAAAAPVARLFVPQGLALQEAAGALVWGSLAASLLLFLPPAFLLGCLGPLAVECVQRAEQGHAGTAGGQVLASSTLGSLAGSFATTHLLLPGVGVDATFLLAGATLGALAAGTLLAARGAPRVASALLVAGLAAGLGLSRRHAPEPGPGATLLAERETPYQLARVVEHGRGDERMRLLQVNEGLDSFQSVWTPEPGLLPGNYYYDFFAPPLRWSGADERWRVCVLGLGAGTAWRVLAGVLPEGVALEGDGVEIDPGVVELGRAWMELGALDAPGERRVHAGWDARAALALLEGPYDQVVLDCYANQMEIPAHLATVELFRLVRERLVPGGWLTVNVGGFGFDDPVVEAVGETAAEAFGSDVLALRVPFSRNVVLVARRDARPPAPGAADWETGHAELDRVLAPLALPGATHWFAPGGDDVQTDDRGDLDRRQRRSIARGHGA